MLRTTKTIKVCYKLPKEILNFPKNFGKLLFCEPETKEIYLWEGVRLLTHDSNLVAFWKTSCQIRLYIINLNSKFWSAAENPKGGFSSVHSSPHLKHT